MHSAPTVLTDGRDKTKRRRTPACNRRVNYGSCAAVVLFSDPAVPCPGSADQPRTSESCMGSCATCNVCAAVSAYSGAAVACPCSAVSWSKRSASGSSLSTHPCRARNTNQGCTGRQRQPALRRADWTTPPGIHPWPRPDRVRSTRRGCMFDHNEHPPLLGLVGKRLPVVVKQQAPQANEQRYQHPQTRSAGKPRLGTTRRRRRIEFRGAARPRTVRGLNQ